MPVKGQPLRRMEHHAHRAGMGEVHFVAYDRHLGAQLFFGERRGQQTLKFQFHGGWDAVGVNLLVIFRAVGARGCVPVVRQVGEGHHDIGDGWRAFEEHVFQQMRHARLAITFVFRTDADHQLHMGPRGGRMGQLMSSPARLRWRSASTSAASPRWR